MANEPDRRDHERFDELALGHVLGGLSGRAASDFRVHLTSCRDCRLRVAELRGIAADLGDIERDERSRERLRTQVVRRDEPDRSGGEETRRLRIGHVTAVAIVVLLLAVGIAFWNLHLRTLLRAYESVTTSQADALRELAAGVTLEAQVGEGIAGRVGATDERIALTLTGIDGGDGDVVVLWTMDGSGEALAADRAPVALLSDGTYAGTVGRSGVEEVIVTLEAGGVGEQPAGEQLIRSRLDPLVVQSDQGPAETTG